MKNENRLQELRNRVVSDARIIHDYVQIGFVDGTGLNLNNATSINDQPIEFSKEGELLVKKLLGSAVTKVEVTDEYLRLELTGGHFLVMSLRPEAWDGPEALGLYIPGEPPVIVT